MGKELSLNILEIAKKVKKLEEASGDESTVASKTDIATEFNTTTTYTKGVMVYYEGKLYQFDADHPAGAWIGTDVHETNVADAILEGGGGSEQKTYGTAVDITAATQSEPYTCPSDGVVNLQSGYASANYTALFKVGWTGFMAIAKGNESQANGAMTVPVLKGDQLYVQYSGSDPVANYYPYE